MKIGLAVCKIKNNKIEKNKCRIIKTIKKAKKRGVDLLLFSECTLHGFDSLTWKYENDISVACSMNSKVIGEISDACCKNKIMIGLGYIELFQNAIYSSYIIIGSDGSVVHNYRRMTKGWKEWGKTDDHYKEGESVGLFSVMNTEFCIGLCGDFWEDDTIAQYKQYYDTYTCWPVFVDYTKKEWIRNSEKEYEMQSKKIGKKVFQINHIANDTSKSIGTAYYYNNGKIEKKIQPKKEGVLSVTI